MMLFELQPQKAKLSRRKIFCLHQEILALEFPSQTNSQFKVSVAQRSVVSRMYVRVVKQCQPVRKLTDYLSPNSSVSRPAYTTQNATISRRDCSITYGVSVQQWYLPIQNESFPTYAGFLQLCVIFILNISTCVSHARFGRVAQSSSRI